MGGDHVRNRPVIGLSCDLEVGDDGGKLFLRRGYVDAVVGAGGVPVLMSHEVGCVEDYLGICDGFILTGGDDPVMEEFGVETHEKATRVAEGRQRFERALLEGIFAGKRWPVLGICLGMQMMALVRGGMIDQYLPETIATADLHWGKKLHGVMGEVCGGNGVGEVLSHHKQAVVDCGCGMEVVGRIEDGVIEAIADVDYPVMCLGVQWHPERSGDGALGMGLFRQLVDAAGGGCQ